MKFEKEELVKSPFNYMGNKYKLLPQLLVNFPNEIDTFYDVFGGGGSLSLNVKANKIYYNDIIPYVTQVLIGMKNISSKECIDKIKNIIEEYDLNKTNLEGFNRLRDDYNKGKKDWITFYTLVCHSFNNQCRFNSKHEYNNSFGYFNSCFSDVIQLKIEKVIKRLQEINIEFDNKDFREIDYSILKSNDLVYFDPPYLIIRAIYSDGKRGFKGWNSKDDLDLMRLCDELDKNNVKFAMSNVLKNKDKENNELIKWSDRYNVIHLKKTYDNIHNIKDRCKNTTDEVLIINYEIKE